MSTTRLPATTVTQDPIQRAYLVGVQFPEAEPDAVHEMLDELEQLADTLGLAVVGRLVVRVSRPQSRYLVGSGKAAEIAAAARQQQAEIIVFDEDLSPSQQRNWEKLSGLCVVDRQELILDIFARRAQTREAVLQVSLAQARYNLPRLKRRWTHLSRQRGMRGGMGLRGEGEQQIEVDYRLVKRRIAQLQAELQQVRRQRAVQRKMRLRKSVPTVAIVGYTNAGKSSLLNALTHAGVLVEDKLFATLDPTVRRLALPDHREILLADTVGFVRKLPHLLVESFRATLEEAVLADLLVEVLDASSPTVAAHHTATDAVLAELGAGDRPRVVVLNKVDRLENTYLIPRLRRQYPDALFVSAKTGRGLDLLLDRLSHELGVQHRQITLLIPHDRYDLIALLHRVSRVLDEKHGEAGTLITASVPVEALSAVEPFRQESLGTGH